MPASALPTCPRTGVTALGYRRDGRPIWPIRGGSGAADPAGTDTNSGDDAGAQPEPGGNPPAPAPAPEPAPPTDRHLAEVEQRASEQSERADQLQAALDAVQQALNPDGTSGTDDPAQLAAAVADRDKQLADLGQQLRTAQVELAAHRVAGEHGARADRLLNSRSFLDSVAGLDPDTPKFAQQLGAAISAAVENDPDLYRAAPDGPTRGGAEFNGPPSAEQRPKSLQDAVAARLGG